MSVIIKRENKKGEISYQVRIRTKDCQIYKSFLDEHDAKLYCFHRERLINNKKNFDIPIKDRVTLNHIIDLKMQSKGMDDKEISSFDHARKVLNERFGVDKFLCDITFEDWVNAVKDIYSTPVFRGSVKEKNKRIMSPNTLKRIFAYVSCAISYAMNQGIELENHALKIIQTHITPMIKKESR